MNQEFSLRMAVAKEREKHLLEKYQDKPGIYFMKHIVEPVVKFGCSSNITERIKTHKNNFGKENVYLDHVIETVNYVKLESTVKQYSNDTFIDLKNSKHTEIIRYTSEEQLQDIYTKLTSSQFIQAPQYDVQLEIEREKTRQLELMLENKEKELHILQLQVEHEFLRTDNVQVPQVPQVEYEFYEKFQNKISYCENGFLKLSDLYYALNIRPSEKTQCRQEFIIFLKKEYPDLSPVISKPRLTDGKQYRGWYHLTIC